MFLFYTAVVVASQFVYQVGPLPTLISTICKANISLLCESEVKIFDRGHRHIVLKQKEKVQTLKMKQSHFEKEKYSRLWNKRSPWNNRSPPS